MLDSDELASFENVMFSGAEEVQVDEDSLLDQYLDALYEKR